MSDLAVLDPRAAFVDVGSEKMHVPPAHVRRLQDYLRLRGEHIAAAAGHVQHMQKALERMNVKLHEVRAAWP